MIYVLVLNDMRNAHVENVEAVARASSREALIAFIERERAPVAAVVPTGLPHYDPDYIPDNHHAPMGRSLPQEWSKAFRIGGPLEWYNPPLNLDEAIRQFVTRDEAMERAGMQWDRQVGELPVIS